MLYYAHSKNKTYIKLDTALTQKDKNFKDLLYMMNKVNELYIKCTKNKKFVNIKNILNNNQSISAKLSSIVKGNLKLKQNPKIKYKK